MKCTPWHDWNKTTIQPIKTTKYYCRNCGKIKYSREEKCIHQRVNVVHGSDRDVVYCLNCKEVLL